MITINNKYVPRTSKKKSEPDHQMADLYIWLLFFLIVMLGGYTLMGFSATSLALFSRKSSTASQVQKNSLEESQPENLQEQRVIRSISTAFVDSRCDLYVKDNLGNIKLVDSLISGPSVTTCEDYEIENVSSDGKYVAYTLVPPSGNVNVKAYSLEKDEAGTLVAFSFSDVLDMHFIGNTKLAVLSGFANIAGEQSLDVYDLGHIFSNFWVYAQPDDRDYYFSTYEPEELEFTTYSTAFSYLDYIDGTLLVYGNGAAEPLAEFEMTEIELEEPGVMLEEVSSDQDITYAEDVNLDNLSFKLPESFFFEKNNGFSSGLVAGKKWQGKILNFPKIHISIYKDALPAEFTLEQYIEGISTPEPPIGNRYLKECMEFAEDVTAQNPYVGSTHLLKDECWYTEYSEIGSTNLSVAPALTFKSGSVSTSQVHTVFVSPKNDNDNTRDIVDVYYVLTGLSTTEDTKELVDAYNFILNSLRI